MPETPLKNKISFYMEAYHADMRGGRIDDFFSNTGELPYIPDDLELLFNGGKGVPVPTEWGEKVDKLLLTDGMEKRLQGAALFIRGTSFQLGQERKIFAPLYLLETRLELLDEVYFLFVDSLSINPSFPEHIRAIQDGEGPVLDDLNKELPSHLSGFEDLIKLRNTLQLKYPDWDIAAVEEMMENDYDNSGLARLSRTKNHGLKKLYPGLGFKVFPKPQGARGVLSELKKLSSNASDSILLKSIFADDQHDSDKSKLNVVGTSIPASLSPAQQKIFQIVEEERLSLLVGPPGTGKSFTIAALAADYISRGKSVLIASKSEQSGAVIARKIEQDFRLKGILVKTMRKTHKKHMVTRMEKILNGIYKKATKEECDVLEKVILKLNREKRKLIKELYVVSQLEMKWGLYDQKDSLNIIDRIRLYFLESKLNGNHRLNRIYVALTKLEAKRLRNLRKYIVEKYQLTLQDKLSSDLQAFYRLYDALGMDKGNMIQESFTNIDFETVLKAFPAWVCQFSDLSSSLPLQSNLFDLLIIDEASQCDIATAIPALYRAKKVLVVGDPQQLRHISFLSKAKEDSLLESFYIPKTFHSFRTLSILDLMNRSLKSQSQLAFLNEHYRSIPALIDFSNEHFYNGQLDILRNSSGGQHESGLDLHFIDGKRDSKGRNEAEASAIIDYILKLVDTEKEKKPAMCTSIGILSPFTKQVSYLKKALRQHLSNNDIKRHAILIGTPYYFQGEERDIMLLSFVLDDQSPMSSFAYLNKSDVFNVSITRARDKQILFVSAKEKVLPDSYLFGQYISYAKNNLYKRLDGGDNDSIKDQFMREIITALSQFNEDTVLIDQFVAGVKIDISLLVGNQFLCIDLVGYPGDFEDLISPLDIERLGRLGHKLHIISYRNWRKHQKSTTKALLRFIESHS